MRSQPHTSMPAWLDKRAVMKMINHSEMTIYRREQLPIGDPMKFPQRFYVGGKAYWDRGEVVEWMIRSREAGTVDTSERRPLPKGEEG
jgi:predicted DNA-binding transcriptional regulator AlpA